MLCSGVLPSFLAVVVLMLAWSETERNAADLQKLSEWGRFAQTVFLATGAMIMFGLLLLVWSESRLGREIAYWLLLLGSVYVAFRDGTWFGWGYTVVLVALLVPYYHNLFLSLWYAWPIRKKLRTLIGKEGKAIRSEGRFGVIVEIDGEEYDAATYCEGRPPKGVTVVVTGAGMTELTVERKNNE